MPEAATVCVNLKRCRSTALVHGDIRDSSLVNELMQDVEGCIHAAAETHVDRSISGPMAFTETNILGSQILLEAARRVGLKKFVQVSTDEVYGSLPLETAEKFTEQSVLKPNSPYAASKASADLIALSYFKTYDLPLCVTRCGNNYGPYQYPEKADSIFYLAALTRADAAGLRRRPERQGLDSRGGPCRSRRQGFRRRYPWRSLQ